MFVWITAASAACLVVNGVDAKGSALSVRMENGTITAAGTVDSSGCTVADVPATAVLTPGLVEVSSSIGLAEVSAERSSVDNRGEGDAVMAAMRVTDAYNPLSVHVGVKRLGGITSAVVTPAGGFVAGQAGWVRLAGNTQERAVVVRELATVASLGHDGSRAMALERLRALIEDARDYAKNRARFDTNGMRELAMGASRRDLEALLPAATGERPLLVDADRAADIEALLRLHAELGLRLIIHGGAEAWLHAEALAKAKIPVIVDPFVVGAGGFREVHGRADNAAMLSKAGVTVLFDSWTHNAPLSAQLAGNAVRAGMDHQAALDAITINPALAFGVPLRTGLRPGNAADLVAWSGDPLENGSRPLLIVIDGEVQPLESRQRALFRKYRTLPGSPLPPLTVP